VPLDATFHGGSNETIGGRVRLRRPEISPIFPLQLSPILGCSSPPWRPFLVTGNKFIGGDNYTGKKFIIGVVVTGDNFSVVSTTTVINLSPVLTTPPIKENP
jgi:hypothetical protein